MLNQENQTERLDQDQSNADTLLVLSDQLFGDSDLVRKLSALAASTIWSRIALACSGV